MASLGKQECELNLEVTPSYPLNGIEEYGGQAPGRVVGIYQWASLVAQLVKNPPAMHNSQVQSLGREDPLAEGMATHSCILAWRIPTDRGAWWATVQGITKSRTRLRD